MKRRATKLARRILLFLLLGALLNVAVAWTIARCVYVGGAAEISVTPSGSLLYEWRTAGLMRKYQQRWFFGPDETIPSDTSYSYGLKMTVTSPRMKFPRFESETIETHAAGWPMLSVTRSGTLPGQFRLIPAQEYRLFVPTKIGFAVDTIFYAAVLWLPFAMIGVVRRRRRAHRGRCMACGYDLRASPNKLCPECGVNAPNQS